MQRQPLDAAEVFERRKQRAERGLIAAVDVEHDVALAERVILELVRLPQRGAVVVEPPAPRMDDLDVEPDAERHAGVQGVDGFRRQPIGDDGVQVIDAVAQLCDCGADLEEPRVVHFLDRRRGGGG